jgi:hypothetical protein
LLSRSDQGAVLLTGATVLSDMLTDHRVRDKRKVALDVSPSPVIVGDIANDAAVDSSAVGGVNDYIAQMPITQIPVPPGLTGFVIVSQF